MKNVIAYSAGALVISLLANAAWACRLATPPPAYIGNCQTQNVTSTDENGCQFYVTNLFCANSSGKPWAYQCDDNPNDCDENLPSPTPSPKPTQPPKSIPFALMPTGTVKMDPNTGALTSYFGISSSSDIEIGPTQGTLVTQSDANTCNYNGDGSNAVGIYACALLLSGQASIAAAAMPSLAAPVGNLGSVAPPSAYDSQIANFYQGNTNACPSNSWPVTDPDYGCEPIPGTLTTQQFTGCRYYRVYCTNNPAYALRKDLLPFPSRGSTPAANTSVLGGLTYVVSTSSDFVYPGQTAVDYPGWHSFDGVYGVPGSGWINNGGSSGWIQIQFPFPQVPGGYEISSLEWLPETPWNSPSSWQFQGSDDGVGWVTLDTRTGVAPLSADVPTRFMITYSPSNYYIPYTYFRLNVTGTHNTNGYLGIGQLRIIP